MLIIGLTGGIGSGKSTVSRIFSELGAPVIDADEIARELVTPGSPALAQIVDSFGVDILSADGSLNRPRLRALAFNSSSVRKKLEAILHPRIREEMLRRVATLDAPYCILVVPLLLETGQAGLVQRVLVVDAPEELQRERIRARDGLLEGEIRAIMEAQLNRAARLDAADDVVINNAGLDHLRSQAEQLHRRYLEIAAWPGCSQGTRTPGPE